ncbi:hypothetical protein TUBRATIS_11100 [Tubulinosema ratisbonensis]|uniref:Uncharacterized protein n=1 Tax=Tubulinosema ratisbonensis TaxID=291195 RepID=A0A437AN24_9MICR|nr:hypothetical protein TUBRATIS_11100 [Tubulinosema ratisbonensis]
MNSNDIEIQSDTNIEKPKLITTFKQIFLDFSKIFFLLDYGLFYIISIYVLSRILHFLDFYIILLITNIALFITTLQRWYVKRRVKNILQKFISSFVIFLEIFIHAIVPIITLLGLYNSILSIIFIVYENKELFLITRSILTFFSLCFSTPCFYDFAVQEYNFFDETKSRSLLNNLYFVFLGHILAFLNFYAVLSDNSIFLISLFLFVSFNVFLPMFVMNLAVKSRKFSKIFYIHLCKKIIICILIFQQLHMEYALKQIEHCKKYGIYLFN